MSKKPPSDKVKEVHYLLLHTTLEEARSEASKLMGEMHAALEKRDLRALLKLSRALKDVGEHVFCTTDHAMDAMHYTDTSKVVADDDLILVKKKGKKSRSVVCDCDDDDDCDC